ncbi:MAG: HAMP domain-containing histidine kinase [Candidatus Nanopelagicales bacterium]|jgi:signal transduction histidine kinase|nr:HAMP domain-containing histidine kinase [Candidatus Nanopelagicales bacterium]
MQRRLVVFALTVVTVAVTVLVIPLALSARDLVRAGNLATLAEQSRVLADGWEALARQPSGQEDDGVDAPRIQLPGEPGTVVLVYPEGTVVGGPVPPEAEPVVASARQGRSASLDTGRAGYAASPAVFDDSAAGAVLVVADDDRLDAGLGPRLGALAAICALLLVGAGVAAWLLARRTAQPIRQLAAAADAITAGDLDARAGRSTIVEVDDVGRALDRLARRVQELLAEEREEAAALAHQLRTPLTVLAADVDAVEDPAVRQRLADDVLTLQRTTDEIITSARRTDREGLRAACDATAVLADRAAFWQVLAEFQQRPMVLRGTTGGPLPVRLTSYDLSTALDIVLQNVFTHTEEGVGFEVGVAPAGDGLVEVVVSDAGTGFDPRSAPGTRDGSTGLGLAIAERIAVASGGSLQRGRSPQGGAAVTLRLGRAAE